MIAGSAGMIVYAAWAVRLLRRMRASKAALLAIGAWLTAVAVVAIPVLTA
jgi:hypothetical protein